MKWLTQHSYQQKMYCMPILLLCTQYTFLYYILFFVYTYSVVNHVHLYVYVHSIHFYTIFSMYTVYISILYSILYFLCTQYTFLYYILFFVYTYSVVNHVHLYVGMLSKAGCLGGFFFEFKWQKNSSIQTKLICSILLTGKGAVRTARAHNIF